MCTMISRTRGKMTDLRHAQSQESRSGYPFFLQNKQDIHTTKVDHFQDAVATQFYNRNISIADFTTLASYMAYIDVVSSFQNFIRNTSIIEDSTQSTS